MLGRVQRARENAIVGNYIMPLICKQTAQEQLSALLAELKQVRRQRGDLPQEVLAARLNVVTNSVADWEAGRDNPSAPHLIAWSRALDLRVVVTNSRGSEIPAPDGSDIDTPDAEPDECLAHRELRQISAALRTERVRQRISQATLAAELGVTQRSISRWESAEGYPRPVRFLLWARVLQCDVRLQPT